MDIGYCWLTSYSTNFKNLTLQAAYNMSFFEHDDMTKAMNGLCDDLFIWVATYLYNFLMRSELAASKSIWIIHHGFILAQPGLPPILVGVASYWQSSPFKVFDPDEEASSLDLPAMTKTSSHGKKISMIEQLKVLHFFSF